MMTVRRNGSDAQSCASLIQENRPKRSASVGSTSTAVINGAANSAAPQANLNKPAAHIPMQRLSLPSREKMDESSPHLSIVIPLFNAALIFVSGRPRLGTITFPDDMNHSGAGFDLLAQHTEQRSWIRAEMALFEGEISHRQQRISYRFPSRAQI
jgi:hypothetical protein